MTDEQTPHQPASFERATDLSRIRALAHVPSASSCSTSHRARRGHRDGVRADPRRIGCELLVPPADAGEVRLHRAGAGPRPEAVADHGAVMGHATERDSPGSLRAFQELAVLGLDAEWDRIRRYFSDADQETDDWVQASTFTRSTFWATAEELA